jgi:cyanophycin synthetase
MIENYIASVKKGRVQRFIRRAIALGVDVRVVSEKYRLLEFRYKRTKRFLYRDELLFNQRPGNLLLVNKEVTKVVLREHGIRVAEGIVANTVSQAKKRIREQKLVWPVVVKPIDGKKGLGVTVGVNSDQELARAVQKVEALWKQWEKKQELFQREFIVEELFVGNDYRVVVLDTQVVACAQRVPAYVMGNGKSTIRERIDQFNRQRPSHFQLQIDSAVRTAIRNSGFTQDSILPKGKRLQLRKEANISGGGRSIDYTQTISPRFQKIAINCARALGVTFVGIDIMTHDITSSDPTQPYGIIEVNGGPEYDLNEKPVVQGPGADVTTQLIRWWMNM